MRILLVNPPFHAITTRYGVGAQIPLGLLLVASTLVSAGHDVRLLDGEARNLSIEEIAETAAAFSPALIMTGHAGSTAAHPIALKIARALKARLPSALIVYGGVFPTYHAAQILRDEHSVDIIVRGEGERTVARLVGSLVRGTSLETVPGIAFRDGAAVKLTAPAEMADDLDAYPAAWQLIEDWDLYRCWGLGRAAVVQFSRGCPHQCSYCGQRGFWTKWRYRDPERTAAEIAWLHHEKGVNFVDLADENPTSSKRLWKSLLEAIIARQLPVKLFATIRATDVVRDADILHLYKKAGIDCVLMGIETTNPSTLRLIRKGSTTRDDREAIRLLRQHGILSMAGHIVGFEEERFRDYWNAVRQLLYYDPDLLNAMYVTPHRWTPFYGENQSRAVIEGDQAKWDYRHQVLGTRHLRPWQIFAMVKATELTVHFRPRALWRLLFYKDRAQRRAYRWCFRNASVVWLAEIFEFFFRGSRLKEERRLEDHAGAQLSFEAPLASALPARTRFNRRGRAGGGPGAVSSGNHGYH
jgi:anaerobic magnesium-protoporphyrin IX monomethyl ester cyclase